MMMFRTIDCGRVVHAEVREFDDEDARVLAQKESLYDPLTDGTWVDIKEVKEDAQS